MTFDRLLLPLSQRMRYGTSTVAVFTVNALPNLGRKPE